MAHTSQFRLLRDVPLTPDYNDTLTFPGVSDQANYFLSKTAYSFTDLMYVRDGIVHIENQAGQYRTCTYCMYQNPDNPGKWFYAFVMGVEYLADGTTLISFVEDIIQTWWFDFRLKACMVAREHVDNDSIGANIKEEPVALGDYVTLGLTQKMFTNWVAIVASAVSLYNIDTPASADRLQGTVSGLGFHAYSLDDRGMTSLRSKLDELAAHGKSNAIVDMWVVPSFLVNTDTEGGQVNDDIIDNDPVVITATRPGNLDGYTPRNKKLLTYPFCGLQVSNGAGQDIMLRYEFFSSGISFQYRGSPIPSGRIILYPKNYAGQAVNRNYGVSIGNYPHGAWTQDVYANWLATQSIAWDYDTEARHLKANFEVEAQTRSGIKGIVSGAVRQGASGVGAGAALGPVGAMVGGAGGAIGGAIGSFISNALGLAETAIQNNHNEELAQLSMAKEREMYSLVPPSVRGSIGSEATDNALHNIGFRIYNKSITAEYAKSIDNFFDLYGYRVDTLKVPNITGRQSWNYVQTIGAIVQGNAPIYAKDAFRGLLDRGMRFWHTTDIGNYDLSNNPI